MRNGLSRKSPPIFAYMNWTEYGKWINKNWFESVMITMILYMLVSKDINMSFHINQDKEVAKREYQIPNPKQASQVIPMANISAKKGFKMGNWLDSRKSESSTITQKKTAVKSTKTKKKVKVHRAQHFSNLTFIMSPTYAKRKGIPKDVVAEKKQNCYNYVKKFKKIALNEQSEYGILASITLAQGLLESNAGDSRLARESDNHFGIKCRRKCRGCTCRNYHDDDIFDMFRVFKNPEESFREHSILLNNSRYKKLKKYQNDYKKWAYGLKKAGYATDKRYAEKLIMIIEAMNLTQYDRL